MPETPEIDWPQLRERAVAVSRRAYVPYSGFPVGAAALTTTGRVVSGCNVENAAYGVVLCAECGLVSQLLATGEHNAVIKDNTSPRELLVAMSCVDGTGRPISPCGRCRQLLIEHAAPNMLVELPEAPVALTDLLSHAFGARNLDAVSARDPKGSA